MPSPFPGMDPYLEDPSVWEEFHHVFITECMYQLSERLPEGYIAKIDERVELVSADDEAARQYIPDVAVAAMRGGRGTARTTVPAGAATAVAVAPVTLASVDALEVKEAYIEILRLPERDLVTSVELLSPWNKFGEGVGQYRSKRRQLVRHGIHVVEIDLLTRGRRTEVVGAVPTGDYFVFVFRGDRKPDVDVYSWGVRQPLPVVQVPLRAPDGDVPLELSAVITSAYDRGRYGRKLRYGAPPAASLSPVDKTWAAEVVTTVRD